MAERDLLVRIIGDDRDLQRALTNTERSVQRIDSRTATFGKNIGRAFAAAGIGIGVAEAFRVLGDSVEDASALNEEIAKSEQIFGSASQEIQSWAQTTAGAIGISNRAALEATGTFGNLFRTVGLVPEESAKMSRALVELAADMASFNNADPSDVLLAIRSGLIGEAEPLRRYGVLLSETRVQQVAMAQSGKDNVKELTNQEKAFARYNIILQDTAIQQGDVARTSGSLANQSRQLSANMEDLSAGIGGVLIPALTGLTGAANEAFKALDALAGIQITEGFDVGDLGGWISGWKEINFLIDKAKGGTDDVADAFRTGVQPGIGGAQRAQGRLQALTADTREQNREILDADREQRRSQRAFDAFVAGMGLKLDKASLTAGVADNIAVLRELERAILRQIEREGKTFELISLLTQTRLQISSGVAQQAAEGQRASEEALQAVADAQQASQDAFAATMDALELGFEVAQATKSLADDQAALRAIEQAIQKRIQAEGRTTDLLRQLFNVRQEQAEVARQLAEQRKERRQGRQFEQLGLTEEGDERVGGTATLERRASAIEDRIKGTTLDTAKTRATLDRIQNVLAGKFGEVGRNVRAAIKRMLDDIAAGFKEDSGGAGGGGEITRGGIRSTQKLIKDLGLTAEQAAELRRRNLGVASGSHTSAFGFGLAQRPVADAFLRGGGGGGDGPLGITNEVRVFIGGQEVQNVITREQQKKGRRTAASRRGRAGGRIAGV